MKSKNAFLGLSCMILFSFFGVVLNSNPALALDVTVCKAGSPTCDYSSIGPAITAVSGAGGGTVTVTDDGIYDELVTMKNGVNLISSHADKAHITRSSGSGKVEVVGFSGAMTCDLKGFEITNTKSGAGIFMDGSGAGITATVENCEIHDCKAAAGIRLNGVISATIIGCDIYSNDWAGIATSEKKHDKLVSDSSITIEDNKVYQNGTGMQDAAGIYLKGDSGNTVNVVIRGTGTGETKSSRIYSNGQAGIRLEDIYGDVTTGTAATIDNNDVNNNSKAGICIIDVGSKIDTDTATATIQNNDIHDNTKAGITVAGASYLTIGNNNKIHENGEAGVAFRKADIDVFNNDPINVSSQPVTIAGNDIYSNAKAGIAVIDNVTGAITIDDNNIYLNGTSGLGAGINLENATQEVTIHNNIIYSNPWAGVSIWDGVDTVTLTTNTIRNNGAAGVNISYDGASPADQTVTIQSNNLIHSNGMAGVRNDSADSLSIVGNDIYSNGGSGIRNDYGSDVTIDQNNIYQNTLAGIGIQNDCTMVITKNKIYSNNRGGIHTGTDVADPGGFSGTAGLADLTIKQNKVYGNGGSDYGGGIDVRHADGTIYNNLVYKNKRGGIRFGDWIDEIINNTVADNGNATDDMGGGIVYDDINVIPAQSVNAPPTGIPPVLSIRNNICAYNQKAGIRACFTNTEGAEERDYNLVYSNNGTGASDCGWPDSLSMSCVNKNFGGCGGKWNLPGPPAILIDGPNNIVADPLFVNRGVDYHLQSTADGYPQNSPAIDVGDTTYGNDVSLPPGEGTSTIDMGAYGGPDGINW